MHPGGQSQVRRKTGRAVGYLSTPSFVLAQVPRFESFDTLSEHDLLDDVVRKQRRPMNPLAPVTNPRIALSLAGLDVADRGSVRSTSAPPHPDEGCREHHLDDRRDDDAGADSSSPELE
jgi:hypothetical protein